MSLARDVQYHISLFVCDCIWVTHMYIILKRRDSVQTPASKAVLFVCLGVHVDSAAERAWMASHGGAADRLSSMYPSSSYDIVKSLKRL